MIQRTQFTAWALDIAADPAAFPTISTVKAVAAFQNWGVELPEKLRVHAEKLGVIKAND